MPLDSKVDDLLELDEDDLKEMLSPSSLEEVRRTTRAISPFTCELSGHTPSIYAILVPRQSPACVLCTYIYFVTIAWAFARVVEVLHYFCICTDMRSILQTPCCNSRQHGAGNTA